MSDARGDVAASAGEADDARRAPPAADADAHLGSADDLGRAVAEACDAALEATPDRPVALSLDEAGPLDAIALAHLAAWGRAAATLDPPLGDADRARLHTAVVAFARRCRVAGVPAERMLVAVKATVRGAMPARLDAFAARDLLDTMVRWSIEAYYDVA